MIMSMSGKKSRILKLKLSDIQLHTSSQDTVYNICNLLMINKNLIFLDLSWSKLVPKDLSAISFMLAQNCKAIRNLNLSYNRLTFTSEEKNSENAEVNIQYSQDFMDNIHNFLCEAMFINHINFSGMNFCA